MRKFTKLLFALALTMIGVQGVKAEKVYEIDYSTYDKFPFYVMGFTPEWVNGIMTDGGGGWHQYFIADGIPTIVGGSYKVIAQAKASANVTFNVNMGWGWGDGEKTGTNVTVPKSNDFVEVVWEYSNIGGTSCNLVAQPNTDATIEWKSLAVYVADPKEVTTYGDLEVVTPTIYVKNYGESNGSAVSPDADGVYTVTDEAGSGDAWAAQFWIAGEYALPAEQKFYVEFDYMADAAGSVGTQTHGATPGSYITWYCIGDVSFKTDWEHFAKEVNIAGDMNGWQSIAFNMHLNGATTYYIKNIALKEPVIEGEAVICSVGPAGWTSFVSDKDVDLGEANGYAAVFNGTAVDLIPVTEVPAGEAVLIEGAGKYTFEVIGSASAIDDNDLEAYDIDQNSNGKYYALADGSEGIGFYPVKEGEVIPAGKAFLDLSDVIDAPAFVPFNDGTTSISEKTIVKNNAEVVYNLAGQRVAQPTKGLYIVNGKKVIK